MQFELILTGRFKKSLKLAKKRGLVINIFEGKWCSYIDFSWYRNTRRFVQFVIKISKNATWWFE